MSVRYAPAIADIRKHDKPGTLWLYGQSVPGEEGENVNANRTPMITHPVSPEGKAMVTEKLLLGNAVTTMPV